MEYDKRYDERSPRFELREPPVKPGEELDVVIEAIGAKGDGIARKEGFVIFVPGVQKGDKVRIRVIRVLRTVAFAERIGPAKARPEAAEEAEAEGEEEAGEKTEEETE